MVAALGCGLGTHAPRADFRPFVSACIAVDERPAKVQQLWPADFWGDINERLDRIERNLQKTLVDLERVK